jgi:predicted  nucleic acid-binding Zn-ribbon protein
MNKTLAMMIRLQQLTQHAGHSPNESALQKRILRLRRHIPENYLNRFDRLFQRRGMAVAAMSASCACSGCHLQLPVGDVWLVREASEMIASCPHCGCFVYDSQKKPRESKVTA